jgi:DNA-directed RNA polymerase specialized sigma24 family protein
MLDDFALAERASADDRPARSALVKRIYHELSDWAYARVGRRNGEVATELVRQTILRVFAGALAEQQQKQQQQQQALSYRGSGRGSDEFVAAIRAVAEAELPRLLRAMHYRNEIAKWPRRQLVYEECLTAPLDLDRPVYQTRIDFDKHEKRAVLEALAKLPAGLREVAHLRYLEGCDFAELVRELGAAPVVVALRLYRATKLLVEAKRLSEPRWRSGMNVHNTSWRRYEQRCWLRRSWAEAVRAHQARGRSDTKPLPPLVRVKVGESVSLPVRRRPFSLLDAQARLRACLRACLRARLQAISQDHSLAGDLLRSLRDHHRHEPPRWR